MLSMSNQITPVNSYTTDEGLFVVGERIIYSDLSPWEIAEIVDFRFSKELDQVVVDLKFEDGVCNDCMTCGMRKLTRVNYLKFIANTEDEVQSMDWTVEFTDAEIDELLA